MRKYLLTIAGFIISFYLTYVLGKKNETEKYYKRELKKRDLQAIENTRVQNIVNETRQKVDNLTPDDVRSELLKRANNNSK